MDFDLSESEQAFRDEVRAWLKANAPCRDRPADSDTKAVVASRRAWQKKLFDAGYVGITWPKEYGGRGAGFMEQLIVNDEMIQAQAPDPINVIGLGMGGPVVISHGTELRSSPLRRSGARASASRMQAATCRGCRPAPRTRATTTWSMDRRFGPLSRMLRSGACW